MAPHIKAPSMDGINGRDVHSHLEELLTEARRDILSQTGRIVPDLNFLLGAGDLALHRLHGGLMDDRKYLAPQRPQREFIDTLWKNLQHPPLAYLGNEFRYRTADGSNNNIMYPRLGAAGSHYARSVAPKRHVPINRPDPSIIFDTLLARKGSAREHPTKVSSALFHFATIIIHDLFHTDEKDNTKVKNSSYLDLGPLYGHNQAEQDKVRAFKDGLLKKDVFAEPRLLGQPPGVCALIIAFNRFHNYIVRELAIINESGRFSLPAEGQRDYKEALEDRDNALFQTGRLITCGLYINIVLGDYLRTILNLNRSPVQSDWKLDPRDDFADVFNAEGTPSGIGNQVSVEFNMIYRWHSTTSDADVAWLKKFTRQVFGDQSNVDDMSMEEFRNGVRKWASDMPKEPEKWTFEGMKRTEDGSFPDAELVNHLRAATDSVAGAFGVYNIPPALKVIEMLGIQQGREWGLASLNEFRAFFKLQPYSTFAEINSDQSVAHALEALYGHPDNVELYPGILCEDTKSPMAPGSGLCPGFTTSFAILSDAVALVRGDRFYTLDYNVSSLTSFGLDQASSDPEVAGGGVMYKLLMRAFPGWYRGNNVYALYPFTTPEGSQEIFAKQGTLQQFDFSQPAFAGGRPHPITTWQGVVHALKDQEHFRCSWGQRIFQLTHHDYMLSGDKVDNTRQRLLVKECLYGPEDGLAQVRHFYEEITTQLILQNRDSRKIGDRYQVDIVRDVGYLAHTAFVGRFFGFPLQSTGGGPDSYTERSLADALAHLFAYVFLDLDPAESFKHRAIAGRDTERLGEVMRRVVTDIKARRRRRLSISQMVFGAAAKSAGRSDPALPSYGARLVERLLDGLGGSIEETVWTIIPTAAVALAPQALGWAQLIDLYLSDKYYHHWPKIRDLALSDNPDDFEKLKKYALEGFRLATPAFGTIRDSAADKTAVKDASRVVAVKKGGAVFADFGAAGVDPDKFPDPDEIKLDRPDDLYIHHGWGPHSCIGRDMATVAAASMLRAVARLGTVRRAPGPAGEMKSKTVNGAFKVYLSEDGSAWVPFPTVKKVIFDYLQTDGR
ncbi:heme peroxidase family protein [Parathielavia appendiculata]|uniref:Heme peroxidase family protein n=1 Tax=Parathielavia appendiculata TaxID=2587402 RepID=A0AAN6YZW8_9PEZI|nr:heme peroxidase family protein [Parathielavia appendiculata]